MALLATELGFPLQRSIQCRAINDLLFCLRSSLHLQRLWRLFNFLPKQERDVLPLQAQRITSA